MSAADSVRELLFDAVITVVCDSPRHEGRRPILGRFSRFRDGSGWLFEGPPSDRRYRRGDKQSAPAVCGLCGARLPAADAISPALKHLAAHRVSSISVQKLTVLASNLKGLG